MTVHYVMYFNFCAYHVANLPLHRTQFYLAIVVGHILLQANDLFHFTVQLTFYC